jgi:hypothetical protein
LSSAIIPTVSSISSLENFMAAPYTLCMY